MADPKCRWRNPYLSNVVELISYLPKTELPKAEARQFVSDRFGGEFFHTPYQLACQLGLYHENDLFFFPKFRYTPTEEEVKKYLTNWMIHYCVPNPYTKKGFVDITPFSIHSKLCEKLFDFQRIIDWNEVEVELFGESIGNYDILRNSINTYSSVIQITGQMISLKDHINYSDLELYVTVDINTDRNNKEYFFDLFSLPNEIRIQSDDLITIENTSINQSDIISLNEINSIDSLTPTEKVQLVKSRIGQGLFRRNLILDCGHCPITGVDDIRFLIASHIKPWRDANNQERLNQKNGLLLTPTYDKLFDQGFISFENNKNLIVSSMVTQANREKLNISNGMNIPLLPIDGREEYIEYHRDMLFKN